MANATQASNISFIPALSVSNSGILISALALTCSPYQTRHAFLSSSAYAQDSLNRPSSTPGLIISSISFSGCIAVRNERTLTHCQWCIMPGRLPPTPTRGPVLVSLARSHRAMPNKACH
ncbi:uncharacterized protein BT62DRAFT_933281 [Guyanagaster necrorhizus]|uniref:Uncharacterized protein n=1 Tax=Guyanagaster necrorhizus TaxID=856835 RepID=A0A9P7VRR5_9AGAR|nr:uncharacterized protein BT62DRAFT_933281 [Guyanagaster necrorhizus MCA 3950]KAG7445463.1 hypothetical protein BT62DRAFT_933281 [Guyanagaster necrorhizus MCA 3950]